MKKKKKKRKYTVAIDQSRFIINMYIQNLQVIRLQVSLASKGNLIDNSSSVDNGEITAMKKMHI